jgi:hypothetical protein
MAGIFLQMSKDRLESGSGGRVVLLISACCPASSNQVTSYFYYRTYAIYMGKDGFSKSKNIF